HAIEEAINAHRIAEMQREAEKQRRVVSLKRDRKARRLAPPAALIELTDALLQHPAPTFEPDPAH
ncbi:hypothetical protein HC928_05260, partial [bacterium]|nr:hypothetical protein [bacterium]